MALMLRLKKLHLQIDILFIVTARGGGEPYGYDLIIIDERSRYLTDC